jgi:hypothetical protein
VIGLVLYVVAVAVATVGFILSLEMRDPPWWQRGLVIAVLLAAAIGVFWSARRLRRG